MINYTERLTLLMQDIVARVPALSFIDMADVLVFARSGRSNAEGAFATCHCLTLPPSEPGYYFWRDRTTQAASRGGRSGSSPSRRSSRSAHATIKYMISFALPRFCDQSLDRSRKEQFYPGADAVDREARHGRARALSHRSGARRHPPHRARGRHLLGELPRPAVLRAGRGDGARRIWTAGRRRTSYDFLRDDFAALEQRVTAASSAPASGRSRRSRSATSSGWREQLPCEADREGVQVEPLRVPQQPTRYTEDDLHIRAVHATTTSAAS